MNVASRWRSLRQQVDPAHFSIGRGAAVSMAVRVMGMGLSYGATVLVSRLLGLERFGEYAVALSWALVLAIPAKAGFDYSALRYSTVYLEGADFPRLRGFLRFGTLSIIILSLCVAVIVIGLGERLMPVSPGARFWSALLVLPLALLAFYSVVLRTARQIAASQFYEQMLRPAVIILGAVAVTAVGVRLSAASAMALTAFAALVALVGILLQLRRSVSRTRGHVPRFDLWTEWMSVSAPMLALSFVQEMMNQIDVILLGRLANDREAALFAASWRLASLVPFALVALTTIAGPLVAAAHARNAVMELHQTARTVARAGFAFAVAAALVLRLLAEPLLGLFGSGFRSAVPVLSVLLIGGVINAFTGTVAYLLTLTGRERQALAIFAAALALSIGLNVLLIPRFGALGAAVASSSATALWNLAMLFYVRRVTGIDASAIALQPRYIHR